MHLFKFHMHFMLFLHFSAINATMSNIMQKQSQLNTYITIIHGYANVANCVTLLGLLFSLAGCFFALNASARLGVTFLIASGICDLFDGAVARKIKRTQIAKEFGVQLDTVVDAVSFGVAPIIIVYSIVGAPWHSLLVYAFYIV